MQIFHGINSFHESAFFSNANNVFTIGMFDGLHLGHKKVINFAKNLAEKIDGKVFVITFDTHPRAIFSSIKEDFILTTNEEKLQILQDMNIDGVIFLYFDCKTANILPEEFVKKDLMAKLNPHTIVVGEDFRFGKDKKGDAKLLQKFVDTEIVPILKNNNGEKISSSYIRELLQNGDIEKVNQMLGHNYFVCGQVIHGLAIARKFGVPTANIHISNLKLLPTGVFAGLTDIEDNKFLSAISIGIRQTLDKKDSKLCLESHVIDFDQDIYHKRVKLELERKIRSQQKFDSLDKLFEQIRKDIEIIKN